MNKPAQVELVVGYLRGVGSDGGGLVAQLQEHRLGRVPLGHLLVGSRSRGDLAVDLHLSHAKAHAHVKAKNWNRW